MGDEFGAGKGAEDRGAFDVVAGFEFVLASVAVVGSAFFGNFFAGNGGGVGKLVV